MKKSPEKETGNSKACVNYNKCEENNVFNTVFPPAGIAEKQSTRVVHTKNPQIM